MLQQKHLQNLERGELKEALKDYRKALFNIDTNKGFFDKGPMANPGYYEVTDEIQKLFDKMRKEGAFVGFVNEGHDQNAAEFGKYPEHCVKGKEESEIIEIFKPQLVMPNTKIYYKNSINGMLNRELQDDIIDMVRVHEYIFSGVCADLCVMDFDRTLSRFLDEINREAKLFAVRKAIDTYDAPDHNREEWLEIAFKVMEQAGIEIVEDVEELEIRERQLGLTIN